MIVVVVTTTIAAATCAWADRDLSLHIGRCMALLAVLLNICINLSTRPLI